MTEQKNIVVVGAGGLAREILGFLQPQIDAGQLHIVGFIDDTMLPMVSLRTACPYPVLGTIRDYQPAAEVYLLLAIADPAAKLRIAAELEEKGAQFLSVVHPNAVLAATAKLGKGVVVHPFCFISADATLGDFVLLNCHSSVGHDVQVGAGSTICAHVDLTGHVQIGRGVFVGSHASVLPSVVVGDFAKIGAGATVVRRVREHSTVYTMPARTL
ncbi:MULTISPECIES: acetyltransferase [unclassified Undibacterium]|uniref:acetyltransferase n=1 Tax=unclassified Undibacterium TaxID=2630295 RepID=UPI002AC8C991|nr:MULTISPECIES: acetyltransferase [unclassified Undibacterium]MEB0139368.1 acetyltransferase [Undibacterium sp. CCC2.1]MEB0173367.1 acetyltransferase [Undibacterium sp. CCC1.1]MEB0177246.1 acetyltransferase [Undibacterium sp. CCC3.4]MEB0216511.1 acetyltransferase [Undibacterium sp. 5I2]WPX44059.1 acetyltransferase [Undibacterium sp. CCC3.4]